MESFEVLSIHNKTLESDSSEFSLISESPQHSITVESGLQRSSQSGNLHSALMSSTSSLTEEKLQIMLFELVEDNRLLRESLQSSSSIMKSELSAIASWHSNVTAAIAQHQISLQEAQAKVQELEGEKAELIEKLQEMQDQQTLQKDTLVGLTKRAASGIEDLVREAKKVTSILPDPIQKNRVIMASTQCAVSASQFVACAKVVALTISNPTCQQQQLLIEAAKDLSSAVERNNKACHYVTRDEKLLRDTDKASGQVEKALNELVNRIKTALKQRAQASAHDGAVDTISSTENAGEMVRQAEILAEIESMKNMCEEKEKEMNVLKSKLVNQEELNSKSHELLLKSIRSTISQAEEHQEKIKTLKEGNEKVVKELEAKVKESEEKLNLELQASEVRRIKHQEDKKLLSLVQSKYDKVEKQLKMQSRKQEEKELEDTSYQMEEWFHGVLPMEEVVRLLVHDGDFLVRETFNRDLKQVVLSVFSHGYKHFIVRMTSERKYRLAASDCFNTIKQLIMHQFQSGKPVAKTWAILRRPIPREK